MLRFNLNLRWFFSDLPMEKRYAAAAEAGFQGVEVANPYDFSASKVARLLADNGLTMVQILAPFDWDGGERGIASHPERVDDFKASIELALSYAIEIGRPLVHVMPGNFLEGMDRDRCRATLVENLDFAARRAGQEGMTIILEPCCRQRFPFFYYSRLAEALDIIKAVGRPNLKLCYDTYHVQMAEGALILKLREYYPYIGHIQIGNAPDRYEPGVGEIHFPYIFDEIERLGWSGWIGCEYESSHSTLGSLGWMSNYK